MSDGESITSSITKLEFKSCVKEYISIFDRLTDIRKDVSMLNKRKKKLSETIIEFMNANEKEFCNLGEQGTIELKKTKSKRALKQEEIVQLLQVLGHSEDTSKETAEYLVTNKTVVERSTLKRSVKPIE